MSLCVLVAACDGTGTDNDGNTPEKVAQLPLVRVEPVTLRRVQRKIDTTSFLEAEHSVVVLSRVSGRVLQVKTDEGQKVVKGQVLCLLDAREADAALDQVVVQLEEKRVRRQLAELERDASKHRELQAMTELDKATSDLARLEQLDEEVISQKELDDARYAKSKADDAHKVAGFVAHKAKLDVNTAIQAIKQLEARKAEVAIQVAEHRILAPITGVVSRRLVKGGETITTATELFEVVDTANLISYLDRPQRELALVENAKHVVFTTDAYPGREFGADVEMISPVVDRGSGSFRIRVRVRSDDAAVLRPGLFIRAQILTEENREAIMIPKTAVLAEGEDSIIFYVRDPLDGRGKARRLRLDTGIEDAARIECRSRGARGLRPGDFVIVMGQQDLEDQREVEISKD